MSVVFGPVSSRRFGMSLGIDLSPHAKSCNFDCVYCELKIAKKVDKISNPPSVDEIINDVSSALKVHPNIDVITLTANGEPTLYPYLKELIAKLNLIKNSAKLLILSNATGVVKPEIYDALLGLDIVKFSLDSAIEKTFRKIDRGHKELNVADIIEKMTEFKRDFKGELVLEILVVKGLNDTAQEFNTLNKAINQISPNRVDISTIDRPPAYPVKGVSTDMLRELSAHIENIPCVIASAKYSGENLDFSKDELIALLSRRPQSEIDVKNSFSSISKQNLQELLADNKIYEISVSGVKFYRTNEQ